jgi:hypothetical protein
MLGRYNAGRRRASRLIGRLRRSGKVPVEGSKFGYDPKRTFDLNQGSDPTPDDFRDACRSANFTEVDGFETIRGHVLFEFLDDSRVVTRLNSSRSPCFR